MACKAAFELRQTREQCFLTHPNDFHLFLSYGSYVGLIDLFIFGVPEKRLKILIILGQDWDK